ncbi:phage tail-collar fiber domain-containing protein [Acinetobacter parvus]|uniref:phage tail-collar fiber domain-containing protein n=1 Tax=Acinetobacter parvus TaxID=134533 RepID=UPI0021CFB7EE|nr:phage tail protein [Acinetobacter parvus]MCU4392799.1 phage tail protein [Acinetobacter parvus]
MAAQYYSIFTTQGLSLLREAIQNGTKLGITAMSFGDGNGVVPEPSAEYTKLVREVYKTQLNRLAPSSTNANWLEADAVIPSAIGGFNIREVGLWAGNILVAYANYPATYKPSADQGTAQIKTIRIVLQIDNTANFELKIDASVVMATIQSVEEAKQEAIDHANQASKNKIETVDSIQDLLLLEKWGGRVVNVRSYNPPNFALANPYLGGKTFTYVESFSNQNNKVTIINGWVRDTSDKKLSTFDAGLTGLQSIDGDATEKLQYLANACENGFTCTFIGDFSTSKHIYFKNIKNLKVNSIDSKITGNQQTWKFDGINSDGYISRGVLIFYKCDDLEVCNQKIKAVQLNNTTDNKIDPFQDGDSCIQIQASNNPVVHNNNLSHSFAWALLAEDSPGAIAYLNTIYDVAHQSGMNICVGSGSGAKSYLNTIYDCGLYGIEWETYTNTDASLEAYSNNIYNCYAGIVWTGKANIGSIHNNTLKNNVIDIWMLRGTNVTNVKINNNDLKSSLRGIISSEFKNTDIISNSIDGLVNEKNSTGIYRKIAPDAFILDVLDNNNFTIAKGFIGVGTYFANGIQIDVTAVNDYVDTKYGLNTISKVTTSSILNSSLKFKQLHRFISNGSSGDSGIISGSTNEEMLWQNNSIKNFDYLIQKQGTSSDTTLKKEKFLFNSLSESKIAAILHPNKTTNVYYQSNAIKFGEKLSIVGNLIRESYFSSNQSISIKCTTAAVAGNPSKPSVTFRLPVQTQVVGVYIQTVKNKATTGRLGVKIDSLVSSISEIAPADNNNYQVLSLPIDLAAGDHTIQLVDTIGDLYFEEWEITLLVSK